MQRSRVQTRITRPLGSNVPSPRVGSARILLSVPSGIGHAMSIAICSIPPPRRRFNLFERMPAWLYLSPALVMISATVLVPLLYALWLSVHADGPNILVQTPFVGLKNYSAVFTSPDFIASGGRTFYFAAVSLAIQLPVGMAIALLLNEKFVGRNFLRALILIPGALPTIV